jgi:hypothetical protein
MKLLVCGLLVWLASWAPLGAQDRDASLERINLALQQPPGIVRGVPPLEIDPPKKLGIFTLVPPVKRGEMIRVSVPVGEMVMRAVNGVASANQRRKEAAARRRVEADLQRFRAAIQAR